MPGMGMKIGGSGGGWTFRACNDDWASPPDDQVRDIGSMRAMAHTIHGTLFA